MNVPYDQQGYYLAAAEAGIPVDNISDNPINFWSNYCIYRDNAQ